MKNEMSPEELRMMQLLQLDMLVELDRVCRANNIIYTISAGTCLGAVRHKGFIPWDDDADTCMLREEYEKFKKVADQLNPEICYFQDHSTDSEYRWGYGKLRRTGTTYVRAGQEHLKAKTGIFIDIFPQDDYDNSFLGSYVQQFICFCARKIMYSELGKKQEKGILRVWYTLLSKIPVDVAFKLLSIYTAKSRNNSDKRARTLCWPSKRKIDLFSNGKKVMGNVKPFFLERDEYEFEGCKLYGPKNYDAYLTRVYGKNYMTPLPPEKRGQHSPMSSFSFGDAKPVHFAKQ